MDSRHFFQICDFPPIFTKVSLLSLRKTFRYATDSLRYAVAQPAQAALLNDIKFFFVFYDFLCFFMFHLKKKQLFYFSLVNEQIFFEFNADQLKLITNLKICTFSQYCRHFPSLEQPRHLSFVIS